MGHDPRRWLNARETLYKPGEEPPWDHDPTDYEWHFFEFFGWLMAFMAVLAVAFAFGAILIMFGIV